MAPIVIVAVVVVCRPLPMPVACNARVASRPVRYLFAVLEN